MVIDAYSTLPKQRLFPMQMDLRGRWSVFASIEKISNGTLEPFDAILVVRQTLLDQPNHC